MLSVRDDDRLRAAVLALKAADKRVQQIVRDDTRTVMGPVWVQAIASRAHTATDQAILAKGTRIKAGNPPVALAAQSTRRLRGGLVPADLWAPFEFGASVNRQAYSTYSRTSPRGRSHPVRRRTRLQLPPRSPQGRVVFPAFAEVAPRTVALWVQSIVRAYHRALDGQAS